MNLLVFGKSGQVGTELRQLAPEARQMSRDEADLTDPAACAEIIWQTRPSAVINAAAFTAVDRAETEEGLATLINGDAPTAMAEVCADLGIPFVHISTDYVFDGSGKRPWQPSDATAPLNAYGRSKLAGEKGVRAVGGRHVILRTSWVFSAHGANFVKTMLRLGASRDRIAVVDDQIGGPTSAREIAMACVRIANQLMQDPSKSGTYHYSGAPEVSWAGFAKAIFAQAGLGVAVDPIPTSAYPTPALRPLNSLLDCAATTSTFGLNRPDWRAGLTSVLDQLESRP